MTTTRQALWAGSAVPENGKGQVSYHLAPKTYENEYRDCVRTAPPSQPSSTGDLVGFDAELSHFNGLQTELASRGIRLKESSRDAYAIARRKLHLRPPDLRAVGAFLRQVGTAS